MLKSILLILVLILIAGGISLFPKINSPSSKNQPISISATPTVYPNVSDAVFPADFTPETQTKVTSEIQKELMKYTGLMPDDMVFSIEKVDRLNDGLYAKGNISKKGVAGSLKWFAINTDGRWQIINTGTNGIPECSVTKYYNIPQDILPCAGNRSKN